MELQHTPELINSGHPISETLPLISGFPWKLILLLASSHIFTKTLGPWLMSSRDSYDLKPFLLIYNGIVFGANGAGIMLDLWVTDWARVSFDCTPISYQITDLKPFFTIYLAYIFFWLHIGEMVPRVVATLMKKKVHWDTFDTITELFFIFTIYYGIKYYPGKASSFLTLVTLIFGLFDYAMRVCASAGPPTVDIDYWQKSLAFFKFLHSLSILIHGYILFFTPSCSNITTLSLLEIMASTLNLINTYRNGSTAWSKAKCLKFE